MASNPVPLRSDAHQGLKISQNASIEHLKQSHIVSVLANEFIRASIDYPIVFVKDPESGEFNSVLMWGIETGENLFVKDDKWIGGFVPSSSRCFPFATQISPEEPGRLFIGLFEDSAVVNKNEGELIFNEDGSETEWMKTTKDFLVNVVEQGQITKSLLKGLDSLGLLVSQTMSMQLPGQEEKRSIDGFFIVDRAKLNELSDEEFLKLRKSNILEIIHAHLASLSNMEKLIRQKHINFSAGTNADANVEK